jgi:hypothetical protein
LYFRSKAKITVQALGLFKIYFYIPFLVFSLEQVFLLGAIAKLGATVVTYPLLVVKVNLVLHTTFKF